MTLPKIVTRDEWLAARVDLLAKEKELTRLRDKISTERRNLPMVEIDKPYRFDGPAGSVGLADLFDGRRQLILYHFMFHPDWEDGCPSCTAGTDELSQGFFDHLHTRDTSYAMVSRAPLEKLNRWKAKKGWDIPWCSSFGTDFNTDFGVTMDESVGADTFNYRSRAEYAAIGADLFSSPQPFDMPGRSCFLRVDDRIFHTYSQYARGLECTGGSYYFLDLTALGRQEEWEEPKGRSESARSATPDFASKGFVEDAPIRNAGGVSIPGPDDAPERAGYRRSSGSKRGEVRRQAPLERVTDDLAVNGLVDFSLRRAAKAAGTTHKVLCTTSTEPTTYLCRRS